MLYTVGIPDHPGLRAWRDYSQLQPNKGDVIVIDPIGTRCVWTPMTFQPYSERLQAILPTPAQAAFLDDFISGGGHLISFLVNPKRQLSIWADKGEIEDYPHGNLSLRDHGSDMIEILVDPYDWLPKCAIEAMLSADQAFSSSLATPQVRYLGRTSVVNLRSVAVATQAIGEGRISFVMRPKRVNFASVTGIWELVTSQNLYEIVT